MTSRHLAQWAVLLGLSAAVGLGLQAVHLPAVLLLGPMLAAILVASLGATIRVPARPFCAAQAVLGCMIAGSIPLSALGETLRDWPLFLAGVGSVILASGAMGWLLARWRVLPESSAIWGSIPGAATVMPLLAEAYGADIRLVAFMQYLRVVLVVVVASLIARFWLGGTGGPVPPVPAPSLLSLASWFPPVAWPSLAATLALAGGGLLADRVLRFPAAPLLLPLAVGMGLQAAGWMTIELPPWLLAASYAGIGWSIGLRFTPRLLGHAARALPCVAACILALIAACGLVALLLVHLAKVDPLTAYLATSPGGIDSVVIIAASSRIDLPFVMAMQTVRFLLVLLCGPALARFIAGRMGAGPRS